MEKYNGIRERLQLGNKFVVSYVGTHGLAHGLDTVLDSARNLRGMLTSEFSRVSAAVADNIANVAGVSITARPKRLTSAQIELLFQAIPKVKIMSPPTACLSPVGEELLQKGLQERLEAEYFAAVTRSIIKFTRAKD